MTLIPVNFEYLTGLRRKWTPAAFPARGIAR